MQQRRRPAAASAGPPGAAGGRRAALAGLVRGRGLPGGAHRDADRGRDRRRRATGVGPRDDDDPTFTIVATLIQSADLHRHGGAVRVVHAQAASAWHFGLRPDALLAGRGLGRARRSSTFYVLAAIYSVVVQPDAEQTVAEDLGADEGTFGLIAAGFMVICVAPVAEEFFFRGFFYRALRARYSVAARPPRSTGCCSASSTSTSRARTRCLILPPLARARASSSASSTRGRVALPRDRACTRSTTRSRTAAQADGWEVSAVLGPLDAASRAAARARRRTAGRAWHSELPSDMSGDAAVWSSHSPRRARARAAPAHAQTPTPVPPPPAPGAGGGQGLLRRPRRARHQEGALLRAGAEGRRARPRAGRTCAARWSRSTWSARARRASGCAAAVGAGGRFKFRFQVGNPGRCGWSSSTRPRRSRRRSARASETIKVVDWQAGAGSRGANVLLLQRALAEARLRHAGDRLLRRRAPRAR